MHFYYIENAKMKESYRAHYLLTSLAVVKRTCFDHDRYVGPGSSPSEFQTRSEFKRQIIKIKYHYKRYVDMYSNSNLIGRNEKKRDPNVNNQCHFYATTVISKVGTSAASANL